MKLGRLNHISVAMQPKPLPGGEGLGWGFGLAARATPNPHPAATRRHAAKSRCPSPLERGIGELI